jgi:hypothetical protein
MQDDQEFPSSKPVVTAAIGLPILMVGGYVAYLVLPVIIRLVMVAIVRTVTGA